MLRWYRLAMMSGLGTQIDHDTMFISVYPAAYISRDPNRSLIVPHICTVGTRAQSCSAALD